MKKSIKRHLLLWLLIPLLSLAVISTIAAYYLGVALARNIYDKQLLNSADSVAARIKVRHDRLTVDLPPAALSILRHNYQDEFYFQVISPDGKTISGDQFLPSPPPTNADSEPSFRSISLKNRELRVVCLSVPTPDLSFDHVVIQAAETRNTRRELANQITMSILFAQLVLIVSGSAAIWIGVGRGLLPLAKVEHAVEARSPGDLSPLQVEEPVEILSLIKALNRLFKQLDNDLELQKRFTSNAAHQLRTPLAVLGTYCDLARKLVKDAEAQDVLSELEAGINRMSKLVNRLLALARSEPGVASNRSGAVIDLNYLASVVTAAQVPEAIRKKIELEFLSASEPAIVFGDQGALEELMSNLIENSILYGQPSGHVAVKVLVRDGKTALTVEDDGPGILIDERERVFERFYRIPGTEQPGTGLGLAIVKEIVAAHHATINVESGSNDKGTSITISFPAALSRTQLLNNNGEELVERNSRWSYLAEKLLRRP